MKHNANVVSVNRHLWSLGCWGVWRFGGESMFPMFPSYGYGELQLELQFRLWCK